jgi:hypothetical protein
MDWIDMVACVGGILCAVVVMWDVWCDVRAGRCDAWLGERDLGMVQAGRAVVLAGSRRLRGTLNRGLDKLRLRYRVRYATTTMVRG